ncbi:hypothetical protein ACFQAT_10395 [Undibacterium arcticum]|uniref:DUF2783 domain-containing protein n=1 Tax=Undibacterium arcticum TaxID=1762892 RepID=A0ABV7F8N8_9BURK
MSLASDQIIEGLVDATLGASASAGDRQVYRTALQWLARLVRAEQCLALEMDMQQAAHAMSDHFDD